MARQQASGQHGHTNPYNNVRNASFNLISHVSKEAGRVGRDVSPVDFIGHCQKVAYRLFFGACNQVISEDYTQLLKSCWIRPEDTSKYSEITSFFKIAGRTIPRNAVIRITQAYLKEAWDGDLLDILDSSLRAFSLTYGACLDNEGLEKYKFFEKVTSCDKNCLQCSYCEELARKLVKLGVVTQVKREDRVPMDITDEMERRLKHGVKVPA
jgi:collagenase-like PrtC family protease